MSDKSRYSRVPITRSGGLGMLGIGLFLALSAFSHASHADEPAAADCSDDSASSERFLEEPIRKRQRPGDDPRPVAFPPFIYESIPDVNSSASQFVPVPDRWRQFYVGKLYDPYNQNVLKGDLPIFGKPGEEWFFEASLISDTLIERRKIPNPVGFASTQGSGSTDVFGSSNQTVFVESLIPSFSLIRGNTTFRPPDFELRFVPVLNFNAVNASERGVLRADPSRGSTRNDAHVGFQELFLDYHLANVSDRYDFVSTRVGIQRFSSDFRGFVYNSDEPGVRLFGNLDNNQYQYNLAWFSRLDKDTNSGLNRFRDRHEDVFIANLYRQDLIVPGHTVQGNIVHRIDQAGDEGQRYDDNGFLVRPGAIGDERFKNIYSTHVGLTSDGHIDRYNVTSALYYVFGSESHNAIAERGTNISAGMAALEISRDINWLRVRASALWASGDSDPYDGTASGFDAVIDTPNFAGGGLSYIQRQGIPLIGGGGVNLFNNASFYPNLRPGKQLGQSNFVNPGLRLYNLGLDAEVLPELTLVTNMSFLQFDELAVLNAVRHDGSFSRSIGFDLSAGVIYRPLLTNNVQLRGGAATLLPRDGFDNLFGDEVLWNVFSNVILLY